MKIRPRQVLASLALLGAVAASSARAQEGVADHQLCYAVDDPLQLRGETQSARWLDVRAAAFGRKHCRILGGLRLVCVPASTEVVGKAFRRFVPPNGPFEEFVPHPVSASASPGESMCYRVQCDDPRPEPPPTPNVTDEFASRVVEPLRPFILCAPVAPTPSPTPTPTIGYPCNVLRPGLCFEGTDCPPGTGCFAVPPDRCECRSSPPTPTPPPPTPTP